MFAKALFILEQLTHLCKFSVCGTPARRAGILGLGMGEGQDGRPGVSCFVRATPSRRKRHPRQTIPNLQKQIYTTKESDALPMFTELHTNNFQFSEAKDLPKRVSLILAKNQMLPLVDRIIQNILEHPMVLRLRLPLEYFGRTKKLTYWVADRLNDGEYDVSWYKEKLLKSLDVSLSFSESIYKIIMELSQKYDPAFGREIANRLREKTYKEFDSLFPIDLPYLIYWFIRAPGGYSKKESLIEEEDWGFIRGLLMQGMQENPSKYLPVIAVVFFNSDNSLGYMNENVVSFRVELFSSVMCMGHEQEEFLELFVKTPYEELDLYEEVPSDMKVSSAFQRPLGHFLGRRDRRDLVKRCKEIARNELVELVARLKKR